MGGGSGWSRRGSGRRPGAPSAEEPEPIATVLAGIRGERSLAAGMALGRLGRQWEEVVGARLAAETRPASFRQGVLVVVATSAGWAAQVRFLADQVRERANELLGTEGVREVAVTLSRDAQGP